MEIGGDMDLTNSCPKQTVVLAKQGEYGNEFSWDATAWIEEFGPGSVGWMIQRPNDMSAYLLPDTEDGNISTITFTETETQYAGKGMLEVFFVNTGQTEKRISHMISIYIEPSLQNIGEVPEPWESYVDAVHEDRVAIENMSATAEVSNDQFGVPNVDVTKSIIDDHVNLDFDFTNLKGNGITDAHLNDDYTLTLEFNEGSYTTPSIRGEQGEKGNVMYATFAVDPITGLLTMTYDDEYDGAWFLINDNGYLEVSINA